MGPGHPPGARITPVAAFSRRQPSAAVRPVHAERVAALVALHVLRLSGDVPPLVAPRADEVGLVDDTPRLGAVLANLQVVPRHAHFHLVRSEEHTSELQSPCNLVCRLLLEKK